MLISHFVSLQNSTYNTATGSSTSTAGTSSCDDINNCRTLLQIIWSCISVLIACTWASVHPNVPGPNERFWKARGHRVGLMLVALIGPELLVLRAARQWFAAKKLLKGYKRHGWTTAHAFFALMGGFALYDDTKFIAVLRFIPPHIDSEEKAKIADNFNAFYRTSSNECALTQVPELRIHDESLAAHADFIGAMPKKQVKAQGHSDGFSKLIAIGQTTWFVVQLIARRAENLPITVLELMTVAFALMTILIYFFWWSKPQGADWHVSIQVRGNRDESSQAAVVPQQYLHTSRRWFLGVLKPLVTGVHNWNFDIVYKILLTVIRTLMAPAVIVLKILLDIWHRRRSSVLEPLYMDRIIAYVAATLFGAIHCIAWTFMFPSANEQLLWRISSLTVTWVPLCPVMLIGIEYLRDRRASGHTQALNVFLNVSSRITSFVIFPIYIVARLDLIVQAFLALRDLPSGAFETVQWTTFIPHI